MKNFHYELPRVMNRVPFVAFHNGEIEVGFGRYAIMAGKWFIALEFC